MADNESNRKSLVLVVEDNKVNRMVARQMLKRADMEVEESDGGRSALERLRDSRYDLVLMDVQMPGMDGLAAARAIRDGEAGEENRHVPIVAMTAYASREDEEACYSAGMDRYLSKPLDMQRFLDTVSEAIRNGRTR